MSPNQRFLLDTNILSDLVRHPQGVIARRTQEYGEHFVCTSIIVACELQFGANKRNSSRLTAQVEAILAALAILPLEPPVDVHYAHLRLHLEGTGNPIGPNDMLIAAQALAENCILVTANTREFFRVPGLTAVDWLEPTLS